MHKGMKGSTVILLVLILAIMAASGYAFFYFADTAQNTGQEQPLATSAANVTLSLPAPGSEASPAATSASLSLSPLDDIPPLYPQLRWSQPSSVLESQALFYDNRLSERDQAKWFWATLDLPGQEWTASGTVPCGGDAEPYVVDFQLYYQDELERARAWTDNIEIEGLSLTAEQADGRFGSIRGFLRFDGENIRVIAAGWEDQSRSSCPAQMVARLFVSDMTPVSQPDQPTKIHGTPRAGMMIPQP